MRAKMISSRQNVRRRRGCSPGNRRTPCSCRPRGEVLAPRPIRESSGGIEPQSRQLVQVAVTEQGGDIERPGTEHC
jgi:hypothetical protein